MVFRTIFDSNIICLLQDIKRQAISYVWTIGVPLSIIGFLQGLLLFLSVKLPDYPSNPRARTALLLSWLVISMVEIVLSVVLVVVIFAFSILSGRSLIDIKINK